MVQESTFPEIIFFHSGYCSAHASVVDPEKGKGKSRFYAVWALIKHPLQGYLLFDTGYTKRFYEATRKFPEKLYALATPVVVEEADSALNQLKKRGVFPSDIKYIIVSHFHADHIGGLLDFPEAKFICSKKSFEEVESKHGLAAIKKGILKSLIPSDIKSRICFIEEIGVKNIDQESELVFYKLFQEENIKLVELPGHASGMLGIWLQTEKEKLLFASDASWSKDTFLRQVKPSKITKLFFDSWTDYGSTFQKLFLYQKKNPDTTLLFTHCPETMDYIAKQYV
jgi:glyoxylase-like metal-dependent hydrolase (beta-lactamase superfamily II)